MKSNGTTPTIYDVDHYYSDTPRGSRLSPILDGLLAALDKQKAHSLMRATGIKGGRALDVGAGNGQFLNAMKHYGFEVSGTTASKVSAQSAKNLYGIDVDVSETIDHLVAKGPFSLVTYWHVFEHLAAPEQHARVWKKLVSQTGFLVIEVPHIDSVGSKWCYDAWLGSDDRYHINHQSCESILTLLRQSGFEPVKFQQFSLKFSYVFLWSALLGFFFGKRTYNCDSIMELLREPLRLLRQKPVSTLNAFAGLIYFMPIILALIVYGLLKNQGEILRIYAKRTA